MPAESESTKEKILDAAERLIARYGFRKMTMEDLASEAGVGKRTIYTYFRSKEDVGLSSLERVAHQAQEKMRSLSAAPGSATTRIREMLRARVMARVNASQAQRQSFNQICESIRPSYIEKRNQRLRIEQELVAGVLEQGRKEGAFAIANAKETAETLLLATNAFLPFGFSVEELGRPREIERRLDRMIDLLLKGLLLRRSAL